MTLALLVLISIMWVPVGMFFLGYGEAKSTGFVSAVVGTLVVIGATLQAAVFTDPFTAGLLFVFGVLYLQTGHALLTGVTDLRTVGNGALLVGIVCAVYAYLFATGGGLKPDGKMWSANMNSFNHYAYGAVGDWMYRTIGGIATGERRSQG